LLLISTKIYLKVDFYAILLLANNKQSYDRPENLKKPRQNLDFSEKLRES